MAKTDEKLHSTSKGRRDEVMKRYATLFGMLILLSACATQPKAEQQQVASVPVHQPVYSTGYVTIHTIPEGAMIFVNKAVYSSPYDYLGTLYYLANGYSPLTVEVQLADGLIRNTLVVDVPRLVRGN
jgi:hypothetical protein